MPDRVGVTFLPGDVTVEVEPGVTVLQAAMAAGIALPAPCGGRGRCGRCAVSVVEGQLVPADDHESAALQRLPGARGSVRLACHARVAGLVSVRPLAAPAAVIRGIDAVRGAPAVRVSGAVDLGTTSVHVRLIDPGSGGRMAEVATINRQLPWGLDVLSRITAALEGEADALARAARDSIAEALRSAIDAIGRPGVTVNRLVVAANPAMASLLAGVDVAGLATHPFSAALDVADLKALAYDIGVGEVVLVPAIEAFVGGDLVAGLLAAGLAEEGTGELFVDVGTNAEVALALPGRLLVASAPAGPAFEGWGIECGGGAGEGGVTHIGISGSDVILDSNGHAPTHLTGSGLLSAVAALRVAGQVSADGRIVADGPLTGRLFEREGVRAIALGSEPDARALFLTQLDIRALQSAKAAVAAAIKSVLSAAGDGVIMRTVIISGAFGGALDEDDLIALGIVPASARGSIVVQSDAALEGASAIAFDAGMLEIARECAHRAEHIDLALSEAFADRFMESLTLIPFDV